MLLLHEAFVKIASVGVIGIIGPRVWPKATLNEENFVVFDTYTGQGHHSNPSSPLPTPKISRQNECLALNENLRGQHEHFTTVVDASTRKVRSGALSPEQASINCCIPQTHRTFLKPL